MRLGDDTDFRSGGFEVNDKDAKSKKKSIFFIARDTLGSIDIRAASGYFNASFFRSFLSTQVRRTKDRSLTHARLGGNSSD
jgi:hypothetical protein